MVQTMIYSMNNEQIKTYLRYDQIDQYNYGLSTKEQLCYQPENTNDITYWKFLVDEAGKFFKERVNELERVCINRLTDMFTPGL